MESLTFNPLSLTSESDNLRNERASSKSFAFAGSMVNRVVARKIALEPALQNDGLHFRFVLAFFADYFENLAGWLFANFPFSDFCKGFVSSLCLTLGFRDTNRRVHAKVVKYKKKTRTPFFYCPDETHFISPDDFHDATNPTSAHFSFKHFHLNVIAIEGGIQIRRLNHHILTQFFALTCLNFLSENSLG